ncbi:hypothetical protein PIB30_066535 [Stylosanthes scabra]|uniref:Uncharacterized protein n=1 Tax=Stylosanthes scabra TaxID=79078 RepID=A0ABU6TNX0_9FABA|nr:hypothetical protein [Stylosanthes scabra]
MGVRVGGEEAREEADMFARYEDEGDDGDQPHISQDRSQRGDPDIVGSSSMMPPMHASHPAGYGAPHPFQSGASPDPFFQATLDTWTLNEAASYRAGRDQRLDPSSSAFVPSPLPFQGMGYTQDETVAREPSPLPRPQRPTRTVRPARCSTGGHLRQGRDDL